MKIMQPMTIYPYLLRQTWVFDSPEHGLKEEAFVLGSSDILSRLVEIKSIPDAAKGFALHFSDEPFADYDAELTWLRCDDSKSTPGQDGSAFIGNWYTGKIAGQQMEGWLCPALGLFFPAAPAKIYVKAESLPVGIDPIWHVDPAATLRFVAAPEDE